jgi:hypothetical protein
MKISNYKLFKESKIEELFESILNESIIYYSPRLRELLSNMNSDIAKSLLDMETKEVKDDITLIDYDETKPDYLTFIRTNKAVKNIENDITFYGKDLISVFKDPNSTKHTPIAVINHFFSHDYGNILSKDRNPIKTTRIIPKIVGTQFTPPQIDQFSRKLSAKISKEDRQFKVVEGDDIAFWYKKENYYKIEGNLGNSCMKSSPSYYFDIYTKNPDVCKLVILVDDDNKLLGRALLWTISKHSPKISDNLIFMDRQYTIDPTDVEHFREYANKNGWAYKEYNSIGFFKNVILNENSHIINMKVDIPDTYDYYPYMDTFKRYNTNENTLHNDENDDSKNGGHYILSDTGGGYNVVEEGHYSEYEDRTIPFGEEVWSDAVDSYLTRDNAVRVTTGRIGWYPQDYEDIIYDRFLDESIHTDDSIYSEWYDEHIYEDDAVRGITYVDEDGEPEIEIISLRDRNFVYYSEYSSRPFFKVLSDKFSEWEDSSYLNKNELFKNHNNKYSLDNFKITLYKIIELSKDAEEIGFSTDSYLSEEDATILNCKINKDNSMLFDQFDYHDMIEDNLQKYFDYLGSKSDQLASIITKKQTLIEFDDNDQYIAKVVRLRNKVSDRYNEIKDSTYNNNIKINI